MSRGALLSNRGHDELKEPVNLAHARRLGGVERVNDVERDAEIGHGVVKRGRHELAPRDELADGDGELDLSVEQEGDAELDLVERGHGCQQPCTGRPSPSQSREQRWTASSLQASREYSYGTVSPTIQTTRPRARCECNQSGAPGRLGATPLVCKSPLVSRKLSALGMGVPGARKRSAISIKRSQ